MSRVETSQTSKVSVCEPNKMSSRTIYASVQYLFRIPVSILDVSDVQVDNAAQSNISAMLKVEIDLPIVCGHSRQGGCKHSLHEFQSLE